MCNYFFSPTQSIFGSTNMNFTFHFIALSLQQHLSFIIYCYALHIVYSMSVRLISDTPTIENTELVAHYISRIPQLYNNGDLYLLHYASNTWRLQLECSYSTELQSYTFPFLNISIPEDSLSFMDINVISKNSMTHVLDFPLTIYILTDCILLHLPTTSIINSQDGFIISISYSTILFQGIKDNLTKLHICISPDIHISAYPLQRVPPQALARGLFAHFGHLTPLESLHLSYEAVNLAVEQASKITDDSEVADETEMDFYEDLMLNEQGQADDELNDFLNQGGDSGMHIEMVGGFSLSGIKRPRGNDLDTDIRLKRTLQ